MDSTIDLNQMTKALYVTGCEDNAWNGEYVTSGSDHWKKDETHEIYAHGGVWRLADYDVAVYATGTSAAQPTDATYEKGCIVSSSRATLMIFILAIGKLGLNLQAVLTHARLRLVRHGAGVAHTARCSSIVLLMKACCCYTN